MLPDDPPVLPDDNEDYGVTEAAQAIGALLEKKPGDGAEQATTGQPPPIEVAPDTDDSDGADDRVDPGLTPPATMTAAEKAAFAKLPREAQEFLARRERDGSRGRKKEADQYAAQTRAAEEQSKQLAQQIHQMAAQAARYRPPEIQDFYTKYGEYLAGRKPFAELENKDPGLLEFQQSKIKHDVAISREQQVAQQVQHAQQEQLVKYRESQTTAFRRAVHELDDDARFGEFRGELSKYLKDQNAKFAKDSGIQPIPDEQLEYMIDAQHGLSLTVARKAMLYDRALAQFMKTKNGSKDAPPQKFQKPGVSQPSSAAAKSHQDNMLRLRKSGRVEDAAKVFERLI